MHQPIQLKNTATPIVRNSINRPSLRHRLVLITLAIFSFLAVCLIEVRADCGVTGDIPFTLTLLRPVDLNDDCLYVTGPWGRRSEAVNFSALNVGQPCTFYAADDTILSPWGEWSVVITRPERNGNCTKFQFPNRINHTYTLDVQPGNRFTLDPRAAGYFRLGRGTNRAEDSSETAPDGVESLPSPTRVRRLPLKAWLGDSQEPSGAPDSDVFNFMGTAGDSVTVRVQADTEGGNNGGEVTLRLMGPTARQVSGELPKRITAELDATGRYEIAVEQAGQNEQQRYRGGYILTVESAQGKIHALIPANSVEK
jgi:hypothetical protein